MTRRCLPAALLSAALLLLGVAPVPAQEKKEKEPSPFAGRRGELKAKLLRLGGGDERSEAAVAAGLKWLALHQAEDGHWSLDEFHKHTRSEPFPGGTVGEDTKMTGQAPLKNDVAATALALLPFLGAGHTHRASPAQPNYSKTVAAGLTWLIRQQDKDGAFPGGVYAHALATLALCETWGMTSDPQFKGPAQKAVNYLVEFQNEQGGWRYSKGLPGDLSVTGWVLQALVAARAAGLTVPATGTFKAAEQFIDSCEDANSKGHYAYLPGIAPTLPMTAVAMLCRLRLGIPPRNPKLLAGVDFLKAANRFDRDNLYFDYYATAALHRMGRDDWQAWFGGAPGQDGLRDVLVKKMDTGNTVPTQAGSWANPGGPIGQGGRLLSTSLSLLCLEAPYRHVPDWQEEKEVP